MGGTIGRACSMYGRDEMIWGQENKTQTEDNIRMDLKETDYEYVEWFKLA